MATSILVAFVSSLRSFQDVFTAAGKWIRLWGRLFRRAVRGDRKKLRRRARNIVEPQSQGIDYSQRHDAYSKLALGLPFKAQPESRQWGESVPWENAYSGYTSR
jgi:hypothetical protein